MKRRTGGSELIEGAPLRQALRQRERTRGKLIVFEGPDGSGKTTQRKLFKQWLESEGHKVVTTKWNSSKLIKPLIKVRKKAHSLSPEEFCLLHAADFHYRLDRVILPALWAGKTVLADRYLFTAIARDCSRGLDLNWVLKVYQPILWPDAVFYFAVSPETSGKRIAATRIPKYYEAGQDVTNIEDPLASYQQFISRVIQEYEALAIVFNLVKVNAEFSIYDQHAHLRALFLQRKPLSWLKWNEETVGDWMRRSGEPLLRANA